MGDDPCERRDPQPRARCFSDDRLLADRAADAATDSRCPARDRDTRCHRDAKRVRQRISAVFVYAIAQGIATSDPAEKVGAVLKPLRRGRQPAITDLVPLRKMILAAEEDIARPITRLGLRMLALTAVRPSELRGAQWAEFEDLDGKLPLWRIASANEGRS